ncbi:MAG: arginine--tRNA ligase [Candidatus Woesearchaeota archaeon]
MDFKEEIVELLNQEAKLPLDYLRKVITIPPSAELGDYAFPCFKLGKNPKNEAEKLKEKLKLPKVFSKVEVAGPYLNFFLDHKFLAEDTLVKIYREGKYYGKKDLGKGKKAVIEYCGPNTNKPLHLGHLRNMALGNSVCRIFSFMGYDVKPVNIINDRGVHICQSMIAYQKWGEKKLPDKKSDHFVGDYYVMFAQKAKEEEKAIKEGKQVKDDLKKQAQELLVKWEQGDKEVRTLWKLMNTWVLEGFAKTYKRFGIAFEKEYFESEMYEHGKEIVYEGFEKKIFKKNENDAIIAPLEKYGLSDKVLLRSDGTSVYITQDLYLAGVRFRDFKFSKMVYVVASEQRLHFQQLFKILELLGRKFSENMFHLSYGLVHLPSGRMKSREGTVVDADDIMDEISSLAEIEIKKRYENLQEKDVKERADQIGLAAIKFFMLQTDSVKDITFNPEESLSFEGETGPYLQYSHARACSILRKAFQEQNLEISEKVNYEQFNLAEELKVIKLLHNFSEILEDVVRTSKPHSLANYLITVAQAFNEFYHKCPVLSEQKQCTKARLLLVDSVRQVLDNGLDLLGIKALEEM